MNSLGKKILEGSIDLSKESLNNTLETLAADHGLEVQKTKPKIAKRQPGPKKIAKPKIAKPEVARRPATQTETETAIAVDAETSSSAERTDSNSSNSDALDLSDLDMDPPAWYFA